MKITLGSMGHRITLLDSAMYAGTSVNAEMYCNQSHTHKACQELCAQLVVCWQTFPSRKISQLASRRSQGGVVNSN